MKRTLSIFLVISFLFNTAGYLLIFLVIQSSLKENAREKISSNNYNHSQTLIVFANKNLDTGIAELKFYDEKEFSFKGKMYDIIKRENKNDSVYFYCLADTEEDELNLAFNKKGKTEETDNNSGNLNFLKNILQDGLLTQNHFCPNNNFKIPFTKEESLITTSNICDIPTPPPVLLPA